MQKKLLTIALTTVIVSSSPAYAEIENSTDESVFKAAAKAQYKFQEAPKPIANKELNYIQAIKLGKMNIVEKFLSDGIPVDDKQGGRFTGLFFASAKGYADIVKLLVSKGADVNAQGRGNWSPLIGASFHGHIDIVNYLVSKGATLEQQSSDGMSPLMYAVSRGKEDVVAELIKLGANVNAVSQAKHMMGKSVLSHAIDKEQLAIAKTLLDAGAKADTSEQSGRTPLIYAAERNNAELISLLLKNGAKINRIDSNGNTPLLRVVKLAKPETVQRLLDNGADSHIRNKAGQTALAIAADFGNTENIVVLASKASATEKQAAFFAAAKSGLTQGVDTFLELGLDVDVRNEKQETVLMIAAQNRHHLMVDRLLEENADIHAVSSNGRDSLMHACAANPSKVEIVKSLLAKGANVQASDNDGNTALLLAAENALGVTPAIIEQLLKAGAKVKAKNHQGFTAKQLLDKQLQDKALTENHKNHLQSIVTL